MKSNKKRLKTLEEIQQLRKNLSGLLGNKKSIDPTGNHVFFEVRVDKPGKLTHLRRMKLTMANGLPRFDLSLG